MLEIKWIFCKQLQYVFIYRIKIPILVMSAGREGNREVKHYVCGDEKKAGSCLPRAMNTSSLLLVEFTLAF